MSLKKFITAHHAQYWPDPATAHRSVFDMRFPEPVREREDNDLCKCGHELVGHEIDGRCPNCDCKEFEYARVK